MKTDKHFFITTRSVLFRIKKYFRQKLQRKSKTHFVFNNFFLENRVVYEILWKNIVVLDTPQMTIWCKRISCWIPKFTNTLSEYVILNCFSTTTGYNKYKTGHGPHSSKIFVLFYILFVLCRSVYCLCVNVYCTTATGWLPNYS